MWREMEEMRSDLDALFQTASSGHRLLPSGGVSDRMLPAIHGEFRVDVREHDDEVIVAADLPGADKETVSLQLLNPRALEISCDRSNEKEEKGKDYYVRERVSGSMRRIVALPTDVKDESSRASFKNGVLEVRLKKTTIPSRSRIEIE
jgi:HSP20 family protein